MYSATLPVTNRPNPPARRIDALVRDYLGAAAPLPVSGAGSIDDPAVAVPVQRVGPEKKR